MGLRVACVILSEISRCVARHTTVLKLAKKTEIIVWIPNI